jgi:hypothetical protein
MECTSLFDVPKYQDSYDGKHRKNASAINGPIQKTRENKGADDPKEEKQRVGIFTPPKVRSGKKKNAESRDGKQKALNDEQPIEANVKLVRCEHV